VLDLFFAVSPVHLRMKDHCAMRLVVYSHDGFGLGNIRRMLTICTHLLHSVPDLSILMLSGSPMLHSFRLPKGLDYIKLPCLNRGTSGKLSAKYLGAETEEIVRLRSQLILSAIASFRPEVFLVDKKPYGMRNELQSSIEYLQAELPSTQLVLLLRDILDHPDVTIQDWQSHGYYDAIRTFYNCVLVVGNADVFDVCQEYQFPAAVAEKVRFCGYIRKEPVNNHPAQIRQELQLQPAERLVLVTPGGGEDGYSLIDTYLSGLSCLPSDFKLRSLIICGPEMPPAQQTILAEKASRHPQVQMGEFTDDLISYMAAADAVVAMGGYNTTCEILSLAKRAIVVPRIKPSQEQWLRAERLAARGLLETIHPDQLTPEGLMRSLLYQLSAAKLGRPNSQIDLQALPRIAQYIRTLQAEKACQPTRKHLTLDLRFLEKVRGLGERPLLPDCRLFKQV
jgi:predicted glycosyltransferase